MVWTRFVFILNWTEDLRNDIWKWANKKSIENKIESIMIRLGDNIRDIMAKDIKQLKTFVY